MYECSVGESPIMRRCKDDWVNATQILKLCNFPKAKRTKILEKGVQQGLHEKVQGGYGRFQGTWIPLPDARRLADEYGITAQMVPVLYIDLDDPSVIIPKKSKPPSGSSTNKDGTPVKRKYAKKTKKESTPKKLKFDNEIPPQAMFSQDYAPSLSRNSSHLPHVNPSMHLQQQMLTSHMPPTFQQLVYLSSEVINGGQRLPVNNYQAYPQYPIPVQNYQGMVPQSKQFGSFSGPMEEVIHQQLMYQQHQKGNLSSTNDTNWSQEEHTRDSDTSISSGDGKGGKLAIDNDDSHSAQLLRFFSEDNAPIPYFLYNPPPEFDINVAIDDEGHTTLHWAASIGNLNLVRLVLSKNANALTVSNYGLNALSKCISFNNCYDLKNFPLISDALEMCLINTDINGRTPLHYLCQFSKVKSKLPALTYYLQILFNKLTVMTNNNKNNGSNLVKIVMDHPDVSGDTCLHLAARAGTTLFVKFFLSHGARDDLVNVNNETAKSIIMQQDLLVYNFDSQSAPSNQSLHQFHSHSFQDDSGDTKRTAIHGLGTPIQNFASRRAETPDTQRTTIQDDDDEDVNDRVSKEHLRTLLEEQAGTVEDNKENIFVDDSFKSPYDSISTPKQVTSPSSTRPNILGMIAEKVTESTPIQKPVSGKSHIPQPPRLDKNGKIAEDQSRNENFESSNVKLPMKDVKSMMHGMMNLLSDSYAQEISGLNIEFKKIKNALLRKKDQNNKCIEKVNILLGKNGFSEAGLFEEAKEIVEQEVTNFDQELKSREAQLVCSIEKSQAFDLANIVQENESNLVTQVEDRDNMEETLKKGIELSQAQLTRIELVNKVADSVKNFAINNKMNKYRKLISLSCGLRVEDIDGLIDGIGESLMGGTI